MTPADENMLYELLPAVFRQRDIAQGHPLLALTKVFDHIRARLGAGISEMEQDWFIQTCPLDYVPLIGGLLGVEIARPVRPEQRAWVADMLGFRRRKGTAGALPRLLRGSSGWFALYAPGPATPWPAWPLTDAAAAGPADAPAEDATVGLLRVWRLPAFATVGATPAPGTRSGAYCFNPLGLDQPLFNLPNTSLDWVAAPPVTALPVPITAAMLAADLGRYEAAWPDPSFGPFNSLLYGPARGLAIWTKPSSGPWTALLPGQIRAMPLVDDGAVAPDYPVLEGGPIDLAAIEADRCAFALTFGDASATLSLDLPAKPSMAELPGLLQNAIETADIIPGKRVPAAAIKALRAGSVGTALLVIPDLCAGEPLKMTPNGANPLRLAGAARLGRAAATLPLDAALLGLLTEAPAQSVMTFTAPGGQVLSVPLPLTLDPATVANAAAAFAVALPGAFVCALGTRIAIVPPDAPPGPAAPATAPAAALGLTPAAAIDPERGRFNWPSAWPVPATLAVDYGLALPAAIGGAGSRPPAPIPVGVPMLADGGNPAWLPLQLGDWTQAKGLGMTLILQGSATRTIPSQQLTPAPQQTFWLVGAAGSQPDLAIGAPGTLSLLGPPSAADPLASATPGIVGLSGLMLVGSLALLGGELDLSLLDTTIYPSEGAPALAAIAPKPPATLPAGNAALTLARCILGPVDLDPLSGTLDLGDSVVSALPVPNAAAPVLALPAGIAAKLVRTTVIGGGKVAGALNAADSLFDGTLVCTGEAFFSNCYVRDLQCPPTGAEASTTSPDPGATITRCAHCGKVRRLRLAGGLLRQVALGRRDFCPCTTPADGGTRACNGCTDPDCATTCPLRRPGQSWEIVLQPPRFVEPNAYPGPNFARLAEANPPEILSGASNHDVLGAYNLSVPTTRLKAFDTALRSALLPGVRLDRRFET